MKKLNTYRLPTEATSCAIRGRSDGSWHNTAHEQRLEIGDPISNSITSVAKDSYVFEPCILRLKRTSRTITTFSLDNILMEEKKKFRYRIRKLTPKECFRLMGVRDSDIDKFKSAGISESQQYKMAGNSIVVDCLVNGIFKNLFIENESSELTLF